MFCAPGLVFGGTVGVGSRLHVLRARTSFRRYRGRRVPFSCIALPDSFSAVWRALDTVFRFCAPVLVFSGCEGIMSRFHVLCSRTRFRWYRGRQHPLSCFALTNLFSAVPMVSGPILMFSLPDTFSAVRRASRPVFMFCAPRLVFGGSKGVGSRFHVLRPRTRFRRYRGRRVPFSCFALPNLF
jgi:hypothetical protein